MSIKWLDELIQGKIEESDVRKVNAQLIAKIEELDATIVRMRRAKNGYRAMARQAIVDMKYVHIAGDIYAHRRIGELEKEIAGIVDEE